MDSALNAEYSDVVLCGAYVDIKNYPTDGLATIDNSINLLRNLNYKQTHQLEWISYDCIDVTGYGIYLNGLPTYERVKWIPLEITDWSWSSFFSIWRWETHDYNYAEVNYLFMRHVY